MSFDDVLDLTSDVLIFCYIRVQLCSIPGTGVYYTRIYMHGTGILLTTVYRFIMHDVRLNIGYDSIYTEYI